MPYPPLFHCHFCYPMSQWISKHFHCNHPGKAGRGSLVFKYNPSMCILFLLHHVMSFLFFCFSHLNWNLLSQTKDFFLSVPQRKHLIFEEVEKTTGWLNSCDKSELPLLLSHTALLPACGRTHCAACSTNSWKTVTWSWENARKATKQLQIITSAWMVDTNGQIPGEKRCPGVLSLRILVHLIFIWGACY